MAVEPSLYDKDWDGWDADWEDSDSPPALAPTPGLPVTLTDSMLPLDRDGQYVPSHLDGDGTVHFFAAVDVPKREDLSDLSSELRYFRAARTDDGRLVHDAHPVMPLDHPDDDPFPRQALETMLMDDDLDNALELAYHTARLHGFTFPQPEALPPLPPAEPESLADVARFRNRFEGSDYRLLEPVDPTVNYSFEVMAADPWTLELTADKWWLEANGRIGHAEQTLRSYSLESYEWEREIERETAAMDRENLHRIYQDEGLEAAMRRAEGLAVANGELNADRPDRRMFTEGPPDRFTTAREAELLDPEEWRVGERIRDITYDETEEMPAVRMPEPGSWDELLAQQANEKPEPERHYWQMHYRPVETPDGEPLGTALFVTEYPQLPPDFDGTIEAKGMDDSLFPTEARTLEMAHFASEDDARKFETVFRSYLVPGLLDGPELAPEVAKLEGLSGEWSDMDYPGIVDYMSGKRTVVREADDWHLHNPNEEREAEQQFENAHGLDL